MPPKVLSNFRGHVILPDFWTAIQNYWYFSFIICLRLFSSDSWARCFAMEMVHCTRFGSISLKERLLFMSGM